MGDLYGTSIDIDDPFFGQLTDAADILRQRGKLALGTPVGSLDSFPEYGFVFDAQCLRGINGTAKALLPLEVRTGLEQEPSFASTEVEIAAFAVGPDGGVSMDLSIQITGATGDAVDFTVGAST